MKCDHIEIKWFFPYDKEGQIPLDEITAAICLNPECKKILKTAVKIGKDYVARWV